MDPSPLLAPLALGTGVGSGTVRAANRLVFGPHQTNLGRGRALSERHLAYYRRRAAGGAGVVVVEEASVHASDWPYERAPLAQACAQGWAAVAQALHAEGALALAALGHTGGQGSSAYSQAPLWAPSGVADVVTREVPKEMEPEDIAAVVAGFAAAAGLAVDAGLDGVEVNAGQHSLVRQFCSPLTNRRADRWGSDRLLFARQVLQAVARAAGAAVVGLRLSLDELAPWAGILPQAGLEMAAELAPLVSYITVVRGSAYSTWATRPDGHVEAGFNLDLAGLARARLGPPGRRAGESAPEVAVVAQGSLVDAGQAAAALAAGTADAVEMTRAQIAEPDLGRLLAAGTGHRARPCILCNQACQVGDPRNPVVSCVGQPSAGHETEDPDLGTARAARGQRVLVVGGGPAGLECARVAAGRGLQVRLVERSARLGGMAQVAAAGAGRARLGALAAWLAAECVALGVEVELGRAADAGAVAAWAGPVVLCTGSRPAPPGYQVEPAAVVRAASEVLTGEVAGPGPILVWDPVGGPVGISVAELLAAGGQAVTLATPDLVVGHRLAATGDLAPAHVRLHRAGVVLLPRSRLRLVTPGSAHLEDRYTGARRQVEATMVVDAGHRQAEDGLWLATGGALARAGDAVAPRTLYQAVLEGRRAALHVDGVAVTPGPWVPAGGGG